MWEKIKNLKYKDIWYKDGLRFECQRCGACCSGSPGIVQFTEEEGLAMADELGIPFEALVDNFAYQHGNLYFLKDFPCEYGYDCVMLQRYESGAPSGCLVSRSKPVQCKTWPFWPEILYSKRTWEQAAKKCPGINKGRLHSLEEIQRQMRQTPQPEFEPPEEECHTQKPDL